MISSTRWSQLVIWLSLYFPRYWSATGYQDCVPSRRLFSFPSSSVWDYHLEPTRNWMVTHNSAVGPCMAWPGQYIKDMSSFSFPRMDWLAGLPHYTYLIKTSKVTLLQHHNLIISVRSNCMKSWRWKLHATVLKKRQSLILWPNPCPQII